MYVCMYVCVQSVHTPLLFRYKEKLFCLYVIY